MSDPALFSQTHVFCCTNKRDDATRRSCGNHGADDLRDYLKKRARQAGIPDIRINTAGCLNRCELGPVMVIYPEGVWYRYRDKTDIDEILETHIGRGQRVQRLLLQPDDA